MSSGHVLRIGTRGSALARAQSAVVIAALEEVLGDRRVEMIGISTAGDRLSERRPRGRAVVGDGQFTAALERALLAGTIDLAVHSLKDLPTQETDGLAIAAVPLRADPRDALISRHGSGLDALPFAARVGTGSARRAAQLAAQRSDLIAMPIRGNVDTRLRRLEAGEYDALVLAAAGLERLGRPVADADLLPLDVMLPAPGQGALAVQARADDAATARLVHALDHPPTRQAVEAERELLRTIGGGCLAPLGALGEVQDGILRLRAAFETRGGLDRVDVSGPLDRRDEVVRQAAHRLLEAVA